MDIQDVLSIAIVASALSLLIEWIKTKWGMESTPTKLLTLALAVIVGSLFVFLKGTAYWATIIMVLGVSSTVYGFFLKK